MGRIERAPRRLRTVCSRRCKPVANIGCDGAGMITWTEDGIPHLTHQAHVFTFVDGGRILGDTMFCGGRWSADLLAEMEAADA